jgi:serine/threonine-protein kinase HipA
MDRRLARAKRKQIVEPDARLIESDYLLGVHDGYRVGALRFKLDGQGDFLDNSDHAAAPPFVQLRHLEQASRALETDEDTDEQIDDWLRMLIAPGGSLATTCGLRAPDAQADCFASEQHTFMVKRFDRTGAGRRLHFASAMTLTDHVDGEDASSGVSYLEIAEVLIKYGSQPKKDLEELWSRIVFNILVSNTDDHLRNHGFILEPGKGWRLSEAYDMNPVPYADGLKLNIDLEDNALDLGLARSVAPYFRVSTADADAIIANCVAVVKQWPILANELGLSRREQEMMAPAFKRAR